MASFLSSRSIIEHSPKTFKIFMLKLCHFLRAELRYEPDYHNIQKYLRPAEVIFMEQVAMDSMQLLSEVWPERALP